LTVLCLHGIAASAAGAEGGSIPLRGGIEAVDARTLASPGPPAEAPGPGAGADGLDPDVVGGSPTTIAEWPWQVALAVRGSGSGYDRQFCGGTLVAPTIVITAAHCLHNGATFYSPDNFSVISGRTTLSSGEGEEINFATFYVFTQNGVPLYQPLQDQDWDVVVVRLTSPAASPTVMVAGPGERAVWSPGQPAFVTGWGDTVDGADTGSDSLLEGRVEIISDASCGASYGSEFHADQMVCAGLPRGGVDTCQGDSGGPLVVPIAGGGFRLAGVTSWGFGCGLAGFPGVYSRIADSPLGPNIRNLILNVAGVDVYGSGAQPLTVPDTQITQAPKNRKTNKRRVRVSFSFASSDPTATFVCSIDSAPASPCASPLRAKVRRGRHTFSVSAVNFIGDADVSPPRASFKVKKKRRR
jgi:hypothetical protein